MKYFIAAALALLCSATSLAQDDWLKNLSAQTQPSLDADFLPVEMAYPFSYEQRGSTLLLSWNVQPGYYMYRRSFRFPGSERAITDSQLPPGNIVDDIEYGITEVYEQPLTMQLQIGSAEEVTVEFQGCAKAGLCYPPTQQTIFLERIEAPQITSQPTVLSNVEAIQARIGAGLTTLVQLTADWSGASKLMKRKLFTQTEVLDALAPLLWIQADVTDREVAKTLLPAFQASGPDTFILFSNTGKEQQRLVGRQTAQTLLPAITKVLGAEQ